jgi:hypothetical protein
LLFERIGRSRGRIVKAAGGDPARTADELRLIQACGSGEVEREDAGPIGEAGASIDACPS